MAMTTRSKGTSPTFGESSAGSDSSDDSKDKFLIAYTRRRAKSESESKDDHDDSETKSESKTVTPKTKGKRAPKKTAATRKTPAKKGAKETESKSESGGKESETKMSEVGSEKGDQESSSSGSSSSSSSASSSNRSTPNQELENTAKEEEVNSDNKSESGDSKSESGESSSDSKSESGDSKSESGDSKSESGESVEDDEKSAKADTPVAVETENKPETEEKAAEEVTSTTKEEQVTPKSNKSTPKTSPLKGNAVTDKSPKDGPFEREYIIRTRAGRGQTSPPPTPTDIKPPEAPTSETKKVSPKPAVQKSPNAETKGGGKPSVSPGVKAAKKRTPAKPAPKSAVGEASSVSSADYHGNSSNDSSSASSVWRRRQMTPTKTDAPEDSQAQLIDEGKRRLSVTNSDGQKTEKDYFCCVCHKEGPLLSWVACQLCPRIYHVKCLNVETVSDTDWVCSECERVLRAECTDTQSKAMSMLNIDQLCVTLKFALTRMKHSSSEPFLRPVDTLQVPNYRDFIFNPMDLGTLEKNIKKKMYGSTEAFLADAKWILHNCIVFNGLHHKLTSGAKTIVKICRHEMSEIEVCPDCYMNAAYARNERWFCEPCRFPHTLVWAKLKGYPFWPAKALREENGHVDCRFFGAHDRAWVQVNQVYLLSKDIPTQMKKSKAGFEESLEELDLHIQKLKDKFGDFHYFPPKTLYKDLESFAALTPRKDVKVSPDKFGPKEQSDTKSTTPSPSKPSMSRYGGSNIFTNIASQLGGGKSPFSYLARPDRTNGKSANAKEGVFTISDSALPASSPLTLPTLNRSFATKAKYPDKTMLDNILKKLQSDDDEQSDSEDKKESPKAKQITPEKMDCREKTHSDANPSTSAQDQIDRNGETAAETKDEDKEKDGQEEDMEVDAEPTVTAPLPQNLKPNPFLESLVNSCKKKLGVDSVKDLKELSSDDSADDDDDDDSSSSDDDDYDDDDDDAGKSGVSGNDADDDDDDDLSNDDDDNHKAGSAQSSDEDSPEKKEKSSKKEKSEKEKVKTDSDEKEKESPGTEEVMETADNSDKTTPEKEDPPKTTDKDGGKDATKITEEKSNEAVTESSQTSKAVEDAAKNSESILMQFLISSTTGQGQGQGQSQGQSHGQSQGQKRANDESSASAAKKLRPTSPPINLPSSAAAAGPVSSSGCSENKETNSSNVYGFNVEKYYQKAMIGLKEVFNEMAGDILTQGANSVVTRHLQREVEQMKWKHEQECQELRHNAELTLAEMRMSWELERDRAVKEVKQQCVRVKDKAIEDAKKRQWCAQCGKEAMFYCCWNTSYCDYPCQQRHWPLHMNYCTQTQGNQSQDGANQLQAGATSQEGGPAKSASASTLSAQALTEQVQRAIQSTNSGVATKKMLSSIYGNYESMLPQVPSSPIQIAQGKIKTISQGAVPIAGPQKNMVYAVQVPTGQAVNLSPVVQQTSANSLIKSGGTVSFTTPK